METYGSEMNSWRTRNGPESMSEVCKTKLRIRIALDHNHILCKLTMSSGRTTWDKGLQLYQLKKEVMTALAHWALPSSGSSQGLDEASDKIVTAEIKWFWSSQRGVLIDYGGNASFGKKNPWSLIPPLPFHGKGDPSSSTEPSTLRGGSRVS